MNKDVNDVLAQLEEEEKNETVLKEDKKILNEHEATSNSSQQKVKDKKNIIIIILSIIIIIMLVSIIAFILLNNFRKTETIDASSYNSTDLISMFKENGYKFEIYYSGETTIYIILQNKEEGITLQRIYNSIIGTLMTFNNANINEESADLIDTSYNDTIEEKQQYGAFYNWLETYNISKVQISTMLDNYFDLYYDEAIDLNALLYTY